MKRKAAVAGGFYPRFKMDLVESIQNCFKDEKFGPGKQLKVGNDTADRNIIGGICPHLGYETSGPAAAMTYSNIFEQKMPDTIIILGCTHTGYNNISIMQSGEWGTPLGDLHIDEELAKSILIESDEIISDESAFFGFPHGREHNIEVQLPFIKYASVVSQKETKIVPIKIGSTNFKKIHDVGDAIARAIEKTADKDVVVIASSDMVQISVPKKANLMQKIEEMNKSNKKIIDTISSYDWKETLEQSLNTTICGSQTITMCMIICQKLGANDARILKTYNSFEKNGEDVPSDYVVSFLSAVFAKK